MKIFKDIFSGDELFSDTYQMELYKDVLYKVKGRYKEVKDDIGFDAVSIENKGDDGSNARGYVIDLVYNFELKKIVFNKKDYMNMIKGYLSKLKEFLKEKERGQVEIFMSGASEVVKEILNNFNDYSFYTGESDNTDAMIIPCKFINDEKELDFYFWKHGLKEEKL